MLNHKYLNEKSNGINMKNIRGNKELQMITTRSRRKKNRQHGTSKKRKRKRNKR